MVTDCLGEYLWMSGTNSGRENNPYKLNVGTIKKYKIPTKHWKDFVSKYE